jgi:hypothetical protein
VVVIDEGPFAEIPDGAAVKLPWGPNIEAMLADALLRLAIVPAARAQIGARAAAETATRNNPIRTMNAYRAAIDAAAAVSAVPWDFTATLHYPPVQLRAAIVGPLWQQLCLVPRTGSPCAVLAIADPADYAALDALGHAPVRGASGWRPEHEPDRNWDIVLIRLTPDSPRSDPAHFVAELNRMLRFGGILVLCIAGLDAGDHVLAARGNGAALLRSSGFRVESAASAPPPTLTADATPCGAELIWKAVKVSAFIQRTPLAA